MAKVIFPDDLAAAIAARTAALTEQFAPGSPYEAWLVEEMAKASAKLDRCGELAIVDLQRGIDRAATCWDDDRRAYVEDLGARLPKDPARVARALGRSKQGADWLLERWERLGGILQANGSWDEAQRRLAFDLLGIPTELRHGCLEVPPADDVVALAALVAEQVDRLRGRQESTLFAHDEAMQAMAAAGMPLEEDAATRRLRRYEAGARRAFHWAHAELQRVRTDAPKAGGSAVNPSTPEESPRPDASGTAFDDLVKPSILRDPVPPVTPPDEPDTTTEMSSTPVEESTFVAEAPVVEPPVVADAPAFLPPTRVLQQQKFERAARHLL